MTVGRHPFAIVTRDDLWLLERHALSESRLVYGVAEETNGAIEARDDCDREILAMCDAERDRVRAALDPLRQGRARVVVSATRENGAVKLSSTISINVLDLSVATTPQHLAADYELLVELASVRMESTAAAHDVPIAWRNGSAAVLLHEAAGHAAERAHAPIRWPEWLTATDESDTGSADLLAGEMPRALRRESFANVPLHRMTNVVVGSRGADVELPLQRVDVLLIAAGSYEPLTETFTLSIAAADVVDGHRSRRLAPFVIAMPRAAIARALRGASGPTRRYPGVICSREGQDVFVSSYAPDVVTEF